MDVRGRGEAALMKPSIARRSTEGKDFTKKRDGFGHVGSSDANNRQLRVGLLVNLASAVAHFAQILVVWSMKIADFGAVSLRVSRVIVDILRKLRCHCIDCA